MGAGIDKAVQLAIFIAGNNNGLASDITGKIVVCICNLAFMRQINPVSFENVLHLHLEQLRISEHVASATIQAFFFIGFNQTAYFCFQIIMHGHRSFFYYFILQGSPRNNYPVSALFILGLQRLGFALHLMFN